MSFDLDTFIKVVSFALSIGAMIYAFFVNRRKDVDERFAAGSKRMDQQDRDIAALRQTVAAMPEKDDLHQVQLAMSELTGQMRVLGGQIEAQREVLKRIERVVGRHEDHLLDGSKSK